MSIFDDLQRRIDGIGFVDTEVTPDPKAEWSAPSLGKDEYQWYNNQMYTGGDRKVRLCFTGDTVVRLLDGTNRTLAWLEKNQAEPFWVYSYDVKRNLVVPGLARNPRITQENAKIVKVTFDDGSVIRCTPDHPFLTTSGTYIEARNLVGQSVESLYTKDDKRGYDPTSFSESIRLNHKCVSVEDAGSETVYDITVDGFHNFAILAENGAQLFVHNCEYEQMNSHALIGSALDIYADNATQKDYEGYTLRINSENDDIKTELEELFYNRLNVDAHIWRLARGLCMYGDQFAELVLQKDKKGILYAKLLPPKTMWRIEIDGRLRGHIQEIPSGGPVHFSPFQLVHWRLPSNIHQYNPYGLSILEPARRHFRQLVLMEDAMVVYRIVRAPERRVWNIDVGNLPPAAAEQFVEKARLKFRKKSFMNQQGNLDWRANTLAPDEDFWLAKRAGGDGTTIDTLPGGENMDKTEDVKYFEDKIFAALKVPRIFLQNTEGTEERKQNVASQDVQFARTIERIQNHILEGYRKIAIVHLMLRGYRKSDLDNFDLSLTSPSDWRERQQMEHLSEKLTAAESLIEFGVTRSYVAQNYLDMSEEEWEKQRIARYKEKMTESKVESGEWTPEDQAGQEPQEEPQQEAQAEEDTIFESKPVAFNFNYYFAEGELVGVESEPKGLRKKLLEAYSKLNQPQEING